MNRVGADEKLPAGDGRLNAGEFGLLMIRNPRLKTRLADGLAQVLEVESDPVDPRSIGCARERRVVRQQSEEKAALLLTRLPIPEPRVLRRDRSPDTAAARL